ncbi:MAG: tRNA (guanosine(37)-N1)-methyltransferase TrmD [Candidatus Pacebacteria bacterium]|nr:tRNA (guanosine(37)-N1)-methyltransferase TrmD [Candidatus Paceibacterota bacterium]MBP9819069.1 tRNA (guanosine(37)-N1)-methyltransferase TrmD [Candidatus Paceibacterota bacterium]
MKVKNKPAQKTVKKQVKQSPLTFHLITLFPESFNSYLNESILARAQKEKLIAVKYYNPRDFVKATGAQKKNEKPYLRTDDKPYGGGPGMVMQALPVIKAIDKALSTMETAVKKGSAKSTKGRKKSLIVFLAPSGEQFTNEMGTAYAKEYSDIIVICGRYEGIDARIKKVFRMVDVTVGPFVTTGGELPAMIMIDVIARQIPGVLGSFDSREESRASSRDVYTRPEVLEYKGKKYKVPEVLLSGNHKLIDEWRQGEERKGGV